MTRINCILSLLAAMVMLSCGKEATPEIRNLEKALLVADAVEADSIMPHVFALSALHLADTPVNNEGFAPKDLFPSDHLTRDRATGYVAQGFTSMGYEADTIVLGDELPAFNVVAEKRGVLFPDEYVLVACHHDAFYGAADDNSSGVAALLEIARAVKTFQFARTIRFVSFDLEEFGSIGSTRYYNAGYDRGVKAAVVMDAIGYASSEPESQKRANGLQLPTTGDYLMAIGNQTNAERVQEAVYLGNKAGLAKTVGIIAPGDGTYFFATLFTRSDHGLLWYKGIPALFFTDGANLRNPNYHKPGDLPETLNQPFLIQNVRLIAAMTAILAEIQ